MHLLLVAAAAPTASIPCTHACAIAIKFGFANISPNIFKKN
jgi:hypothetical protein